LNFGQKSIKLKPDEMVLGLLRQSNHQNAQPRPVRRAGHAFYRFGHWFATQVNAFDGLETPVAFLESQDKWNDPDTRQVFRNTWPIAGHAGAGHETKPRAATFRPARAK